MSGRTPVRRCPVGLPACLASRAARRELAPHASAERSFHTRGTGYSVVTPPTQRIAPASPRHAQEAIYREALTRLNNPHQLTPRVRICPSIRSHST